MGAYLHDIGKLAVPLSVMNKATRLNGREKEIGDRLEIYALKAHVAMLEGKISKEEYEDVKSKTEEATELMNRVNGAGFVDEETRAVLARVLDYVYNDTDGTMHPFFTDEEKECLRIVKGTLTGEERKIMESHVEILNGKGYPKGLTAEDLSTDARIMAVADICDALLATDRPYKKPIPKEKAFDIMRDMARAGNIDAKLVEYLYQCIDR